MSWIGSAFNGQNYQVGLGVNSLGNNLYYHAGEIGQDIYNDSREIWNREDTAVQRWVKDVEAAGLNPYGFTGQGAATSSNNPSMDSLTGLIQVLGGILNTESTYTQGSRRMVQNVSDLLYGALNSIGRMI